MANFLQNLANAAKAKAGQVYHTASNDIAHIGAAPHPVQTVTPQVQQALAHPQFVQRGLQTPVQRQQFMQHLQVPQPTIVSGLNNLGAAQNDAVMKTIVQPFISRPAAEVAATVMNKKQLTPPQALRPLFGDTPIQSIQQKVGSQYQRQSTSSNPLLRLASKPLAVAEAGLSVANDLPVVGGAIKGAGKGLKAVSPELAVGAEKLANAAVPATKQVARAVSTEVKAANTRIGANDAITSQQNKLAREAQGWQKQQAKLPLNDHKAAETLQRKIDGHTNQIQALEARKITQNPIQKVTDKLLTSQAGMSTRRVDNRNLEDLNFDKQRYLSELPTAKTEKQRQFLMDKVNQIDTKLKAPASPASKPKKQLPSAVKPAPQKVAKAALSVKSEVSSKPSLPVKPIDTKAYIKQQVSAQDAARKAGNPTGLAKLKAPAAEAKTKLIDSLSPIEDKLNTKITKDNATGHITPQLDRALRADTIANQYIKDNGLAKVIQRVPNTKEFDQYLIAKHAKDLETNGIKTGRDMVADEQLVKELGGKYEQHAQALKTYSNNLLDQAAKYGLISKDLPKVLKEKYPNYVPANRIFSEDEMANIYKGTGAGKASIGSQTVVQKIKGSGRQIESPLASLITKTHDVIDQGERNKAAQILTGYKDLPGNPFNLRKLGKDEQVGSKHVISVLQDGKKVQFETTKEIEAAAKSLSKEQLGLIGKILSVPTRVLRLGATGLNPAFTGANVVKDLASGALNSKNPLRSSVANPTVFLDALKASLNHGSKQYGELVREGAGGTSFDIARNAPKQNIANIRAEKNVSSKIAYTVTHPSQLLRAAENTIGRSEEFSRALQYYGGKQASLAKGASEDAAKVLGAHAARNNTVNFARSGDYGRVLNSVLPYLNAGIQGSRTFVRNAAERPAQTATKLVILGFMPVATTTAWNLATPDRKEAYDDIKPYEKQGNIIIVPPHPKKDANDRWNVIKIPVSQEIANLNNVVRNGIETGLKDGTFEGKQLIGDLIGTTTSLNAQSPRQALGQVIPQGVKPALESVVNQNLFTGNKIIPDSQKHLDAKDQYGTNTSGTAKVLGRNLNIAPRGIDNFVSTAGGGLAKNLINVSDNALAKAKVIKPEEVKGKSFGSAIQGRFSGATGSNKYDIIDKQTNDLTKQMKALPAYKAMDSAEKAKALNRISSAVLGTYTSKKALSVKQQAVNEHRVDVSSYLTPATVGGSKTPVSSSINQDSKKVLSAYNALNADQRKQKQYKENNYDYKVAQAKYENDLANNKLSKAQVIRQKDVIAKEKVGADYSKDTRDLYGLSKQEVYNLVTTDNNGKKIAADLMAYGDALQKNGIEKNKFRTSKGAESFGDGTNSATKSSKAKATKSKVFKSNLGATIKAASTGNTKAKSYKLAKVSISGKIKTSGNQKYSMKKLTLNKKA